VIYSKTDILEVWKGMYRFAPLEPETLKNISSSDWLNAGNALYYCPMCGSNDKKVLIKLNGKLGCIQCQKVARARGLTTVRTINIYRLTNDLFEFFGEVSSEKLFDPDKIKQFVKFYKLDTNVRSYVLLLKFLRALLTKEIGIVKIYDFVAQIEDKLGKNRFTKYGPKPKQPKAGNNIIADSGRKEGGVDSKDSQPKP
jgi:hypothetical protein